MRAFCGLLAAVTSLCLAQGQTGTAQLFAHGKSVQLLPSTATFVPGIGNVTAYFSTFNGTTGTFLIDTARGGVVSGELRPRTGSAGVYEGGYAQASTFAVLDYGSYTVTIPSSDSDSNGIPDVMQYERAGNFTATGSGYSLTLGQTFSISILFARSAGSAVGSYTATTRSLAGQVNVLSGTYALSSYSGSVSYTRGTTNTMAFSVVTMFSGVALTGTTTYTISSSGQVSYAAFTLHDSTGVSYQVRAGTMTRSANTYRGTLSLVDGNPSTYWADFTDYVFSITDTNDSDLDGIPDLSDTAATPPSVTNQPANLSGNAGATVTLDVGSTSASSFQWQRNGISVATTSTGNLNLTNLQPSDSGLYSATLTNGAGSTTSRTTIVGVATTEKVVGNGSEIAGNIAHPNGNVFDQVLLDGPAATFTAEPGQVTRVSFIDLTNDIVQVEFSGAGSVSIVLQDSSGPAPPVSYNQPSVGYMKGHAGIVVTGANETSNLSIFTVGRATAFDPTGKYNILQAPSATNVAANNGSSLFAGQAATVYDGLADIAFVAISSTNQKFGSLRTANARYWAANGVAGVYAPGVEFTGPVFVGDITAMANATPYLQIGSASEVAITGGDLIQDNGRAVQVSGITRLNFREGSTSHGVTLAAKNNGGVLEQDGVNITAQVVVNPGVQGNAIGLVAYYPFEGNSNDISGNGNNAMPGGSYQYVSGGLVGGAIRISGDNSLFYAGGGHVVLPTFSSSMNSGFTVSLWAKDEVLGGQPSVEEWYIGFGAADFPTFGITLNSETRRILYYLNNGSGGVGKDITKALNFATDLAAWKHLVLTYAPGKISAYFNGVKVGEESITVNVFPVTKAALGRHWWSGGAASSARMSFLLDNVRIYNRALTDAEVQALNVSDRQ